MFIVRYGEIGLKGKNRGKFEEILERNIIRAMQRVGYTAKVRRTRGRIFVYAPEQASSVLGRIPGIISYSPAVEMSYEEIPNYLKTALSGRNPASFKVEAHRVDKNFPRTSPQINEEIGAFVVDHFGWSVNLTNPELIIGIEIIDSRSYVFFDKYPGVGGLPVGSAGKLLLLISPGMDSPVAGYMLLRRGANIVALHFSQGPLGEEKVRKYIKKLSEYTPRDIELVIIPHHEIMDKYVQALKDTKREEWTCVFCKYLMLREAERVANEKGALGIITGDSLGQVASQTLQNMMVESMAAHLPIYRPLIGMDKVDIESIAREIGTLPIFLAMQEENCPFRPSHVVTTASQSKFLEIKRKISEP